MRKIVVGVDGSAHASAALRWADREAQRHGASLVAVMAWTLFDQHHRSGRPDRFDPAYDDDAAADALGTMIDDLGPRTDVERRVVCDLPAAALVEASEGADLLVVGARGLGGFRGLLLGSVSERVLEQASCPVAVVRAEVDPVEGAPIVVGFDGSPHGNAALHWAAAEARCRGSELHVVHSWEVPAVALPTGPAVVDALEEAAHRTLGAARDDDALDGLVVKTMEFHGSPAAGLLLAATDASLLVVGSRGQSRVESLLLGSTSRQVARHATVPVVVIPGTT